MKLLEPNTLRHLFDPRQAFESGITVGIVAVIGVGLVVSGVIIYLLAARGKLKPETATELRLRWRSWCAIVAAVVVPILLGAAYWQLTVMVLSLLCYREYARSVGVFRRPLISIIVVLSILFLTFASFDHFDRLYFSWGVFGTGLIVVGSVLQDEPKGFIQRVALGVLGYLLFGYSLGYLSLMANSQQFRPLLLTIILAVECNDIFAYLCGKAIGGRKLLPQTSPGKTVAGAVGALILCSILVAVMFHFLYPQTALDNPVVLVVLGGLTSVLGQLGDLTLSSIKRDVGIKDFSGVIPGHGGFLDRFDSLVFVPPVVYHFVSLFLGALGDERAQRIVTGGSG